MSGIFLQDDATVYAKIAILRRKKGHIPKQ